MIATPAGTWTGSMRRPQVASALLVGLLAVVGILATLGLRAMTEGATVTISKGGVTAAVPEGWRVKPGAGDLAFIAMDPRNPQLEYLARVIDPLGIDIATVAAQQSAAKGALVTGYVLMDTTDVTIAGASGIRVRYAYLSTGPAGTVPRLVRGADFYAPAGDRVLGLTFESPSDSYEANLDQFYRFVGSARVEAAS